MQGLKDGGVIDISGQFTGQVCAEELVLTLKKPIKNIDGSEITELKLREPTAGEWIHCAGAGAADNSELTLLALVSGINSRVVLKQLAISDYARATRFLTSFTNVSQETGKA